MNTRSQATTERREERQRIRTRLRDLKVQLRDARVRYKRAIFEARERCRADRLEARERARAMRPRVLWELRTATKAERASARETCATRMKDARALSSDVARERAALAAERQLARDLRTAEKSDRERRRAAPPCACTRHESDDEVLAGLPSDLAALYERVKRQIKTPVGRSRTEGFLKWAETHPHEVLEATQDPAHVDLREIEKEVEATARKLNPYEAKKAARIERMKARAERLASASHAARESAQAIAGHIPAGQPILAGHHSERRHRRDLERIDRGFSKSVELHHEAEALRRRAEHAERSGAISSDDPEAIAKLRAKLEDLAASRAKMVAANKAIRSREPRHALAALGFTEKQVEELLAPDPMGRIGFPNYALSNASSEAGRVRKRIEELEKRASTPGPAALELPGVRVEEAENRVRIIFEAKPPEEVRTALKRAGFRWSPNAGAWQRHASNAAWYEAKRVLGALGTTVASAAVEAVEVRNVVRSPANTNVLRGTVINEAERERVRALTEKHAAQPKPKGDERLDTAEIAALIRADIKEAVKRGELPKAKYSVKTDKYSMGSSITVVASDLPFPALNPDAFIVQPGASWVTFDSAHHQSRFTPEAQEVERKLNAIVDAYHWDRSDAQTDHYNERFHRDVRLTEDAGAWKAMESAKVAAARAAEERV